MNARSEFVRYLRVTGGTFVGISPVTVRFREGAICFFNWFRFANLFSYVVRRRNGANCFASSFGFELLQVVENVGWRFTILLLYKFDFAFLTKGPK